MPDTKKMVQITFARSTAAEHQNKGAKEVCHPWVRFPFHDCQRPMKHILICPASATGAKHAAAAQDRSRLFTSTHPSLHACLPLRACMPVCETLNGFNSKAHSRGDTACPASPVGDPPIAGTQMKGISTVEPSIVK
jgi:hypothetical protein